ncbi:hypothetical protein BgAZ_400260 [Babesia gibsoni]|uniref:Uncharacterized protein n=1 Tax=Babesia gibsoni TaxID=33632 RepID=A0AAD8LMR1_BABGI|nr:hypothetical protein BgAZ_400260 [Babesia gibsoni]
MLSYVSLLTIAIIANVTFALSIPYPFDTDKKDIPELGGGDANSSVSSNIFGDEYLQKVESALKESYGDAELQFFRKMINDFQHQYEDGEDLELNDPALEEHISTHIGKDFMKHYSSESHEENHEMRRIARALVFLIKDQFKRLEELQQSYVKPNLDRFIQIQSLSKGMKIYTDTPCSTQAACDRLEMMINLCSYIRGGTHMAYEIFVVMVHVLGTMMAVLCGCLFVGPTQICFLQNFPYTCRIPFPVFSGMFQATTSVWQLVKVATNICRIYGDPGFGSVFA